MFAKDFYFVVGDRTLDNVGHVTVRCTVTGKYLGTGHVQCPVSWYPINIHTPDMSGIRQDY